MNGQISALSLGPVEIALRFLCAMFIGLLIGTEREYTHRPAGMRTHMLVALGSCAVMITSQMIFAQYNAFGATPDPARLSAQVITGVGFLGAGTIMREGPSIKGLTTAASIWSVACLGIAVGGGYYGVGLIGTACMMVTLVVFEWLQQRLMRGKYELYSFTITGTDAVAIMELINKETEQADAKIKGVHLERREDGLVEVSFKADFTGRHASDRLHKFLGAIGEADKTTSVCSERTRV
ncbi:MAG: MgtC/SapB family protein [Eubacteriales bacterium]|nr:MgtC/SapB family protein [Eubacteriales bacterium]